MFKLVRNIKEKYHNTRESGNTLMMALLFTPLIFGMMGFVFDLGLAFYTKTSLQAELDSAAVNGAQQTIYSGKNQVINYPKAKTVLVTVYKKNRNNFPAVNCNGCKKGTPVVSKKSSTHLKVRVQENSPTLFMHMIGIPKMDYTIESEARLGHIKG